MRKVLDENLYALAAKLGELLQQKALTITSAESCTGGGFAYALTSVPGSSAWFKQSVVTYSNNAKQFQLGVCHKTLNSHGAVSQQTVREMARGALEKAHADIAVSISGIAGPEGGTEEKPVGTVWFGFALNKDIVTVKQIFSGDRQQVREKSIQFALEHLLTILR